MRRATRPVPGWSVGSRQGAPATASLARAIRGAQARLARRRVWAPVLLRGVALGIALLGLAGIGSVVGNAPAPRARAVAHAELGLDALSARALASLTAPDAAAAAATAPEPAAPEPAEPAPAEPAPAGSGVVPPAPAAPSAAAASAGSPTPCPTADAAGSSPRGLAAEAAPVVLNRADATELQRLPGVGAKRAEAILKLRQRLGRFRRPSDLLRVKGIGRRTLERMLPHLVLD